jgi:hypothetical protein
MFNIYFFSYVISFFIRFPQTFAVLLLQNRKIHQLALRLPFLVSYLFLRFSTVVIYVGRGYHVMLVMA